MYACTKCTKIQFLKHFLVSLIVESPKSIGCLCSYWKSKISSLGSETSSSSQTWVTQKSLSSEQHIRGQFGFDPAAGTKRRETRWRERERAAAWVGSSCSEVAGQRDFKLTPTDHSVTRNVCVGGSVRARRPIQKWIRTVDVFVQDVHLDMSHSASSVLIHCGKIHK